MYRDLPIRAEDEAEKVISYLPFKGGNIGL
jgi:hypothetical protein